MPAWARLRTAGACLALFGALGIAVAADSGVTALDRDVEAWIGETVPQDDRDQLLWISLIGSLPVAILLVILTVAGSLRMGSRRNAIVMLGAVLLDLAVRLLKLAFDYPRPDDPSDPGFPSAHTARGVGIVGMAMFLLYDSWRAQRAGRPAIPWWAVTAWLIVGALTGIARVVGGVHWTSDVVGGFLLGIAFAMAANHFAQRAPLRRARTQDTALAL